MAPCDAVCHLGKDGAHHSILAGNKSHKSDGAARSLCTDFALRYLVLAVHSLDMACMQNLFKLLSHFIASQHSGAMQNAVLPLWLSALFFSNNSP